MYLKVMKSDGQAERYMHTKVLGTINNAFDCTGRPDIAIAEELAEVVTYFFFQDRQRDTLNSSEVLSAVKAVLAATGYEEAAVALSLCHYRRKLKRARIEVVHCSAADGAANDSGGHVKKSRWDKAQIVNDLVSERKISRKLARAVASMVEEKVLNMGINPVPTSLIAQLVECDFAVIMRADQQLHAI